MGFIHAWRDSPTVQPVGSVQAPGLYSAGHLLFSRGRSLLAQPFDLRTRTVHGEPFVVVEPVVPSAVTWYPFFDVSPGGALVYRPSLGRFVSQLTWLDRTGRPVGTLGEPDRYTNLSLSRDGRRVAVSKTTGSPPNVDIWLFDLTRPGLSTQLTRHPSNDNDSAWSPDTQRVVFNSNRLGMFTLFWRPSNGTEDDEPVFDVLMADVSAPDWSPRGDVIAFAGRGETGRDLYTVPTTGQRMPVPFLQTRFEEQSPAFSPDGRWIAYDSNISGRTEIYIDPFPKSDDGKSLRISLNGGWSPRWRRDGRELVFLTLDGVMMSVAVDPDRNKAETPQRLFSTGIIRDTAQHQYAVTADAQRFLLGVPVERVTPYPLTMVLNWAAAIGTR